MKKCNLRFLFFVCISLFALLLLFGNIKTYETEDSYYDESITTIIFDSIYENLKPIDTDWETFITALTWVESRHNDSIINKSTDATGQFQITPIYVKEANRLQSEYSFCLEDRFDYEKSRLMFDIIQEQKNPKKDKRLACRIHYGSYCEKYYNSVINRYKYLLNKT